MAVYGRVSRDPPTLIKYAPTALDPPCLQEMLTEHESIILSVVFLSSTLETWFWLCCNLTGSTH